ncbi:NUDIX hydrolase [Celerinatantimonas diazotrophica]|uniref:GDP-mannose pyrophosphatase n=1 Tax=Celerinatantimonas diazotrophica TaxID=412034 RepID=A0A4R1J8I0_9GAMM|nr:NUDIX hydrolase [Celerinatantimonas diazotrophica]TCK46644.1 ADP-ribose pyrophosphatase [Celerinatantimonas diazotrophica]CAG9295346.1 ADP-ribose pyrophosphatase [Celerinatantimonas diazotrophica]
MSGEKLFSWSHFSICQSLQRYPDGCEREVTRMEHPGAVVIVPIGGQGEFVLERQYRAAVDRWLLEFPAGTMERGEDPLECAKRELAEEVGLAAQHWQNLGTMLPAPGFCNEVQHLFLAQELSVVSANPDEDEIIEMQRFNQRDLTEQIRSGAVIDSKTVAAFYRTLLALAD